MQGRHPLGSRTARLMTGHTEPGPADSWDRQIARGGDAAIQRDSTGLHGDYIRSAVRFDVATPLLVRKVPTRPRSGAAMGAGGTMCRLQLLNRIQRKMAAQSSVVGTATLAVLACRRLERSSRVVRCRHLCGDREEAASTARSPALLGGHDGDCCASCRGASIPRGAAYRPALHHRKVAHPLRGEHPPQHLVRCPGIWLSPSPRFWSPKA